VPVSSSCILSCLWAYVGHYIADPESELSPSEKGAKNVQF